MTKGYLQNKDALNYFLKEFEKEEDSVKVIETYRALLADVAATDGRLFLKVTEKLGV